MKELITRIHSIEQEQRLRANMPLNKYNKTKVHQKQMEFHRCKKNNRWVFGGNRSGKTECGAVETIWLARGIHPFRQNKADITCWVVSLSQQVQRDVAQQKILHYLNKSWIKEICMTEGRKSSPDFGVIDFLTIENVFGGTSRIAFKSCEAGREKFQGTSLDFVWFDEEPPFDIYIECRMRTLDREGHIFGTMTPLKGLSWVYHEIYLNEHNDSEVWQIAMEWADNPFLKKKEVEALSATLSESQLDSRRFGRFQQASGLVYTEFKSEVHVIEPFDVPTLWQDCMSIDPGLNNPLSCHWYAVDGDGVVYVVAEHYEAGRDVAYHVQKIKEICKLLNWQTDRFGKLLALMDSAANQHTLASAKSVAELFCEQGITVNTRVNKNLFSGINVVKSYLQPLNRPPKIFIFKNCVNMIREIKQYRWGDNDTPKKVDDHAMDELRYYLCSKPQTTVEKPQKTVIQRDKESLYRQLNTKRTR